MNIKVNEYLFKVKNVEKSPLLYKISQTQIGIDKDEDGNVILDDLDPIHFYQYAKFLNDQDYCMDKQVAQIFNYMGHINERNYELQYWKAVLNGNKLRKVPLVKKMDEKLPKLKEGYCIAGGYALYLSGHSKKYTDIDYFCIKEMEEPLSLFGLTNKTDNPTNDPVVTFDNIVDLAPIQMILKVYNSMEELVGSFDLDICQFVYDGENLHATDKALWAVTNRTIHIIHENVVDREHLFSRIYKYMKRTFCVDLPNCPIHKPTLKKLIYKGQDPPNPNWSITKMLEECDLFGIFTWCEIVVLYKEYNNIYNPNKRDQVESYKAMLEKEKEHEYEEFDPVMHLGFYDFGVRNSQ